MSKKEIKGYPGYWITDSGKVWSDFSNKFISIITMESGYERVVLTKKNKSYNFLIHRLVAQAFIPNPENKPCVNHKDLNKSNNQVENLEWVTYKENNNYLDHNKKMGQSHKLPVIQCDKKGRFLRYFSSEKEAAVYVKGNQTNIGACCKNKPHYITAYGFKWRYATSEEVMQNEHRTI